MRGTADWSKSKMLDLLVEGVRHASGILLDEEQQKLVRKKIESVIERLDDAVRNPGLTSQDRAVNHAATKLFSVLAEVASELVMNDPAAIGKAAKTYELNDITVNRSQIGYAGSDCWDVEFSFFNPENHQEALVIVSQPIDVNDAVPALVDKPRKFRRR